ncbi:MAG: hypothetical protein VW268_00555 [Rhodospirillaceae bacterium]
MARKRVDKTGKSISAAPAFRDQTALDEYTWVVETKQPLASRDIVDLDDLMGRLPFEQRLIRLPLLDDGENVTHVVSLATWDKL